MNRLWLFPVMAVLLTMVGTGVVFAAGSLLGPTGIVALPTAAIAAPNKLDLSVSYQKLQMYAADDEDLKTWRIQALTGITDMAELWAAYSTVRNDVDTHIWGLGGKLQLTKEPKDTASLALGASYNNWADGDDISFWNAYIVATKDFTPMKGESWEWGPGAGTRMLGSLGLMYIKVDLDVPEDSLTRPFVGLEFIGAGGTQLGLEYRWRDNDAESKAVFSAVLKHPFSKEVWAELGTTNASPLGTGMEDQDIFVRVGYSFPIKGY